MEDLTWPAGAAVVLEYSTNLQSWQREFNINLLAGGLARYRYPSTPTLRRWWRLRRA